MTGRECALKVLRRALKGDLFISELLDAEFRRSRLPAVERGLATELACGVLRRRGALDRIIARAAGRSAGRITPVVLEILRMGAYQLLFLDRVPAYAAVSESVELAKRAGARGADKFVNAVLRKVPRRLEESAFPSRAQCPAGYIAAAHSHPLWLVERWVKRWGVEEAESLCAAGCVTPALTVRVNTLRCPREELIRRLAAEGVRGVPNAGHPRAVDVGELHRAPRDLAAFRAGLFQVQDVSGMRIADLVGCRAGERTADLCAGPGGKATALAEAMGDRGEVMCLELSEKKAKMIRDNAKRLGLRALRVVVGDASKAEEILGRARFDRVLVDAPCSNTGVLARRPEARWRLKEGDIARLAGAQRVLLDAAVPLLKPGGTLVYATCSVEPEENEDVVSSFLRTHHRFKLEGALRFLPHKSGCDGGYAARFVDVVCNYNRQN